MEERNKVIKKETLIAAVIVPLWIGIFIILLGILKIQQGWPAYLSLLFFMESGGKPENLKKVFIGGVVGILISYGVAFSIPLLVPIMGNLPAILLVVCSSIFLLILFGDVLPLFLNNYAFAYFMIASILPKQMTIEWVFVLLIGGTIFCAGVLGTMKYVVKRIPN